MGPTLDVFDFKAKITSIQLAEALLARLRQEVVQESSSVLRAIEDVLLSALVVVRQAINITRPINLLPPEILAHIFHHVPSPLSHRDFTDSSSLVWPSLFDLRDVDELRTVTHVCRHWREIALASSTLWNTIDERTRSSASTVYLTRSREAPLKIRVHSYTSPFIKSIYQHNASRIQTLYHCSHYGAIVNSLNFSAEQLEVFGLEVLAGVGSLSSYASRPVLFNGHAPGLKVLALSRVPWLPANRLQNLTHLSISENFVIDLSGLLDFLSGAPGLRDIVLRSLRVTGTDVAQVDRMVTMNHLRRLAIGMVDGVFVSCLLSHMALPKDIALRLFGLDTDIQSDVYFMRTLPPLPFMDDLTKLSITMGNHAGEANFSVIAAGPASALRVDWQVKMYWDTTRQLRGEWARSLIAVLPMAKFQELWVDGTQNIASAIEMLLATTASLTSLIIRDNGNRYLLQRIFDALMSPTGTPPRLPCPNLTSLRIQGGMVRPAELIDLALTRERFGHPLKHLYVAHTSLTPGSHLQQGDLLGQTRVDSLEFTAGDDHPSMSLPPICVTGGSSPWFWPQVS